MTSTQNTASEGHVHIPDTRTIISTRGDTPGATGRICIERKFCLMNGCNYSTLVFYAPGIGKATVDGMTSRELAKTALDLVARKLHFGPTTLIDLLAQIPLLYPTRAPRS